MCFTEELTFERSLISDETDLMVLLQSQGNSTTREHLNLSIPYKKRWDTFIEVIDGK